MKPIAVGVLISTLYSTSASTDQSEGYINLSGNVPAFFELWVRGVPGDLDFGPRVIVNDRLLGLLHLKYNINLQSLTLKSDKVDGKPHLSGGGGGAWGGGIDYKIGGGATCVTVGGALGSVANQVIPSGGGANTMGGGMNVRHNDVTNLEANFGYGIEEDCPVMASWTGVNQDLPLAGTYTMKIVITMVSF